MLNLSINDLLLRLINIPSLSENELQCCEFVYEYLNQLRFDNVKKIPVDKQGFNIMAVKGKPKIALQAHLDTVPPFIKASSTKTKIFGRGACDTKSCVTAMITASKLALEKNLTNFALIFTVGEETNFHGADLLAKNHKNLPFMIVGEPSNLKPVNGHFGIGTVKIIAKGKAAHSSTPDQGINAIEKLIEGLNRLEKLKPKNGSLLSLVKISGGHAENVIPDQAEALFSFRTSPEDKDSDYPEIMKQKLKGLDLKVEPGLILEPVHCDIPPKLQFLGEGQAVRYATELSFFKNGLVLGPGDIKQAHAKDEFIKISALNKAVEVYLKIIERMN